MPLYKIGSETANATIDTAGGRLASLEVFGHELLVTEGDKPTRWGSFPMIPWCGRLANGRFEWYGKDFQFPLTSPPHANHGVAHLQDWELFNSSPNAVNIMLDLQFPWTFGGTARQRFEITENQLLVEAMVEAGRYRMPVMVGWHPWFRRQLSAGEEAHLTIRPTHRYETNADLMPTGALAEVGPPPWNDCFVGVQQPPIITWPGALQLAIESSLDHWVVFTEPEHALCVEPQSGPPNEFNLWPRIIQPGQRFLASMTWTWRTA